MRRLWTFLVVAVGFGFLAARDAPRVVRVAALLCGALACATTLGRELAFREMAAAEEEARQRSAVRRARALIVGAGAVGQKLAGRIEANGQHEVVGFADVDGDTTGASGWPILGAPRDVAALVRRYGIDEVIVAYAPTWQQRLVETLATQSPEVRVSLVPTGYDALLHTARFDHAGEVALLRLAMPSGRTADIVKRLGDVLAAAAGLLLVAPLLLLLGVWIRATSAGPAIFTQERVGRRGCPFTIYKLRTMRQHAEEATGPVFSSGANDPRLIPLGRVLRYLGIDELPQLWNVLRGDMSLVGPRPERPFFVQQFERTIPLYAQRHAVRPGITGLAQVCSGYRTDARDKLRFDLLYVRRRSPALDLAILFRTASAIRRTRRGSTR